MRSLILFLSASSAAIAWVLVERYGTPLHLTLAVIATIGGCLSALAYAERGATRPLDQEGMHAALAREIFRARRYERPFAAVLIDLTGVSDRTREIATALRGLIRKTDEVGFWAERRLLLVLAESNVSDALALADRLRKALSINLDVGITDYAQDDSIPTVIARLEESLRPPTAASTLQVSQA